MSRSAWVGVVVMVAAAAFAPSAVSGQRFQEAELGGPVRGELGVNGILAMPVGEFANYVDLGGGIGGFGVFFVDDRQVFGLRLDASWIIYGSSTVRRQLSPTVPFVNVEVTTQNGIGSFAFGPQIALPEGPVRPYARAGVGFSYFQTKTSVKGSSNSEPFASSTNFDDTTFALSGGAGLRIGLAEADAHPISLDLGVSYLRNGRTEYLREGGLRETPSGGVEIDPIRSETNLVGYHLGVTVGLR